VAGNLGTLRAMNKEVAMTPYRIILLGALLLHLFALNSQAQINPSIEYHWVTQNRVFLWKGRDDLTPTIATLGAGDKWDLPSADVLTAWRPIFSEVIQKYYPKEVSGSLTDDQVWSFALTQLRNEYTDVKWAKPRMPFAEIYLKRDANDTVLVAFIRQQERSVPGEIFTFTLRGDTWKKGTDIDLQRDLNLVQNSEQLRAIFDFPATIAQVKPGDWPAIWDNWLKVSLNADEAIRPLMYVDKDNLPRWLWRERLGNDVDINKIVRRMPPKPAYILQATPDRSITSGTSPTSFGYKLWLLLSLSAIALISAWLARRPIRKFVSGLKERPRSFSENFKKDSRFQTAMISREGIDLLHSLAAKRCEDYPIDAASKAVLLQSLNWIHAEYLALLDSGEFEDHSGNAEMAIIEDYWHRLGFEQKDDREVIQIMKLGSANQKAISNISKIRELVWVKKLISANPSICLESNEDWIEHWPSVVEQLAAEGSRIQQGASDLKAKYDEVLEKHGRELNELEQRTNENWKGKVHSAEEDLRSLTATHAKTNSELSAADEKIRLLTQQLSEARDAHDKFRSGFTNLIGKKDRVQQLESLSSDLRRLIQGYFYEQRGKSGDMRPVGLVASLINFSLYQMCFSIMQDRSELTRAMAHNLLKLTQLFSSSPSRDAVNTNLHQLDDRIEYFTREASSLADNTLDDALFRAILSDLKRDTGINLGPFFIDLNESQKITRVNAA
jgi:hypothetical protein